MFFNNLNDPLLNFNNINNVPARNVQNADDAFGLRSGLRRLRAPNIRRDAIILRRSNLDNFTIATES